MPRFKFEVKSNQKIITFLQVLSNSIKMAPRKNDESKTPVSTKKSLEKKTAKPKVKQLMPKLKPLVIKLNMPPEISSKYILLI